MDLTHLFPQKALGKSGEVWGAPGSGEVRGGLESSGQVWGVWGVRGDLGGPGRSGEPPLDSPGPLELDCTTIRFGPQNPKNPKKLNKLYRNAVNFDGFNEFHCSLNKGGTTE